MKEYERIIAAYHRGVEIALKPILASNTISCRKGCSACCRLMVLSHRMEIVFLAEKLITEPFFQAVVEQCLAISEKVGTPCDQHTYHTAQLDCPLLDPSSKECLLYDIRPTACRYHLVKSPPEDCADLEGNTVQKYQVHHIEDDVWEMLDSFRYDQHFLAPLPIALLFEIVHIWRFRVKDKKVARYLSNIDGMAAKKRLVEWDRSLKLMAILQRGLSQSEAEDILAGRRNIWGSI